MDEAFSINLEPTDHAKVPYSRLLQTNSKLKRLHPPIINFDQWENRCQKAWALTHFLAASPQDSGISPPDDLPTYLPLQSVHEVRYPRCSIFVFRLLPMHKVLSLSKQPLS